MISKIHPNISQYEFYRVESKVNLVFRMSASFAATADEAYELITDRKKLIQYTKDVSGLSASTSTANKPVFVRDLPYDDIYEHVENIGIIMLIEYIAIVPTQVDSSAA